MTLFAWADIPAVAIASTRPDVVAGLGPDIETDPDEGLVVSWTEGGHERRFRVSEILADEPARFAFRDMAGHQHELVPLTLEVYRARVRPHTLGRPDFASTEEMIAAMRFDW